MTHEVAPPSRIPSARSVFARTSAHHHQEVFVSTITDAPVLEPAAQAFTEQTSEHPFLFELPPEQGRAAVDDVQSGDIAKPAVDEEWIKSAGGPTGEVPVRIVRPHGMTGALPAVLYIHGAGWVFGDAHTHDRLV